jgi:hypothetical protein
MPSLILQALLRLIVPSPSSLARRSSIARSLFNLLAIQRRRTKLAEVRPVVERAASVAQAVVVDGDVVAAVVSAVVVVL